MAKLIKVKGKDIEVSPANGTDFTLDELQMYVGGYIELVNLPENRYMVVNEDGLGLKLEENTKATRFLYTCGIAPTMFPNGFVRGDVLVCDTNQIQ